MRHSLIILLLIIYGITVYAQDGTEIRIKDLSIYTDLNDRENRLLEYKDDINTLKLKLIQLEIINNSRKKYKAGPVKLDILASRVANKMCHEAAEYGFISHWNLAGEKPYQRYAFAGGYDHIAENAYGEWTTGVYENSVEDISERMKEAHRSFMSERAPNDGHKKNVIGKSHNYAGIGIFSGEKQFRYYEEFIDRYFEFESIPSELKVNESGNITFNTDGTIWPYYLIIYRENAPQPMKVSQLKKTGSYADFSNEEYLQLPAWEIGKYKKGNSYTVPLKFSKPGHYYIHIYFDRKEIKKPSALDTKGKAEGCGIVIKVNR